MKFAIVDLETTGLAPDVNEIIEIGAVIVEKKGNHYKVTDKYSSLIKPYHEIPPIITNITGIDDYLVKDAPRFQEIAQQIIDFVGDAIFVAHNVLFDLKMLNIALERYSFKPIPNPFLDTQDLAAIAFPSMPSHKLQDIIAYLEIESDISHRALADAEATGELLIKAIQQFEKLPPEIVVQINRLLNPLTGAPLKDIFNNIQQKQLKNIKPAQLQEINNWQKKVLTKNKITKSKYYQEDNTAKEISPEQVEKYFSQEGEMKRIFPYYEQRPQQMEMAQTITSCLNNTEHLLMEAGTGIGKSLAYLIPSLLWIKKNGGPVVVSTRTKNLQAQLIDKDIPKLIKLFPDDNFQIIVLKGRTNYLCLRRFELLLAQLIASKSKEIIKLLPIFSWLTETESGDLSELHTSIEKRFGKKINSDYHNCNNEKCPRFKSCFLQKIRKQAKYADIVIANHSLVFTDLSSNSRLLPRFEKIIFDEAHAIENAVTDSFAISVGLNAFTDDLKTIDQYLTNQEISKLTTKARADLRELFFTFSGNNKKGKRRSIVNTKQTIGQLKENNSLWTNIELCKVNTNKSIKKLLTIAEAYVEKSEDETLIVETKAAIFSIGATWRNINNILEGLPNYACWLSHTRAKPPYNAFLEMAPINVGNIIRENLLNQKESVIMTSATLTVKNSFSYYKQRLGIDEEIEEKFIFSAVGSPFHYEEKMLLALPEDILNISTEKSSLLTATEYLLKIFDKMDGRSLVLFTSYRMLEDMHSIIKPLTEELGISILCQGMHGSARSVLRRFKHSKRTVLFGTSSFWEGVDISGNALSFVAIMKLPFSVPTEPIYVERTKAIEEEGGNAFYSYAIPQAVIRFKQGIGRLIRSQQDKGVVMVLDERIFSKNYGKLFLESLPNCQVIKAPKLEVLEKINEWY